MDTAVSVRVSRQMVAALAAAATRPDGNAAFTASTRTLAALRRRLLVAADHTITPIGRQVLAAVERGDARTTD